MSAMTTRVGPLVICHATHKNNAVTIINDTRNQKVFLDLEGNTLEVAIRFAAKYVQTYYEDYQNVPLIGIKTA